MGKEGHDDEEDEDDIDFHNDDEDKENLTSPTAFTKLKVKFPFRLKGKPVVKNAVVLGEHHHENNNNANTNSSNIISADTEGQELDENGNIKPSKRQARREGSDDSDSDDDSDDDDSDDIVKRREKNLEDNKRMLERMMAEFDGNAVFKPASMRRLSLPRTTSGNNGADSGARARRRQSLGATLRYSNRKSPPRTRSRGVDGEHARGLKDEPNTLRRRINYDDEDDDIKVYFDDDEDEDAREAEGIVEVNLFPRRYCLSLFMSS